jgi:DNA invertase Pin-like site-specific DNA recombinase
MQRPPILSPFKRTFERVTVSDFVAYYRVSTDKQGRFGLGMEAQREAVTRFLATRGQLAGEFVEVESGKNHANRPQLTSALAECRKRRAVLVIAKLDRLARNVHFISGLMNSDVEFVAVDMPTANRLTIHILAAVAEHEREMISQRTKAALAAAKARGTRLGNPRAAEAAAIARAAKKLPKPEPEVLGLAARLKKEGKGLRAIARELNRLNIRTPLGSLWHPWTVRNQLLGHGLLIDKSGQFCP